MTKDSRVLEIQSPDCAFADLFDHAPSPLFSLNRVYIPSPHVSTARSRPAPSEAELINLSTRGFVGTGAAIMIAGVSISAEGPKTLLVRAVGPTLALDPLNVPDPLADPKLTIFSGQTPILSNDDWGDNPEAAYTKAVSALVFAFGLPEGSKDAALVVTLPPSTYTIHASAADGVSTGVALVEVYVVE